MGKYGNVTINDGKFNIVPSSRITYYTLRRTAECKNVVFFFTGTIYFMFRSTVPSHRGNCGSQLDLNNCFDHCGSGSINAYHNWLVVWLPFFIFPYLGNNHPNWLIFFGEVQTTNQIKLLTWTIFIAHFRQTGKSDRAISTEWISFIIPMLC